MSFAGIVEGHPHGRAETDGGLLDAWNVTANAYRSGREFTDFDLDAALRLAPALHSGRRDGASQSAGGTPPQALQDVEECWRRNRRVHHLNVHSRESRRGGGITNMRVSMCTMCVCDNGVVFAARPPPPALRLQPPPLCCPRTLLQ